MYERLPICNITGKQQIPSYSFCLQSKFMEFMEFDVLCLHSF